MITLNIEKFYGYAKMRARNNIRDILWQCDKVT